MRTLVPALGLPLLLLACKPVERPDFVGSGGGATTTSTGEGVSAVASTGAGGHGGEASVGASASTGGTGGSGGAAVASATVGSGGAGGGTAGSCTNAADTAILGTTNVIMISQDCGINNVAAEPATRDCIKSGTGLSDPCVVCFDDAIQCVAQNCLNTCAPDPNGQPCKDCRATYCDPALNTCAGVVIE